MIMFQMSHKSKDYMLEKLNQDLIILYNSHLLIKFDLYSSCNKNLEIISK